eukprot:jgi/Chrzof1/5684/Cz16g11180.t1
MQTASEVQIASISGVDDSHAQDQRFHEAYAKAYTMSQLYVANRPSAIPLTEYDTRRKKRDKEEILQAAKKRGKKLSDIEDGLVKLDSILCNLVNLNLMKAADWVTLAEDVEAIANKLIILKTFYPSADIYKIVSHRPKILLQSHNNIAQNAKQVKALLSRAKDADAIIQAVPELADATALVRSLAFLRSSFPNTDPVELLQENPTLLLNLGESNVEDSAEYGEMTTKD